MDWSGIAVWLAPWRLVCWRARVALVLLIIGGVIDLLRYVL